MFSLARDGFKLKYVFSKLYTDLSILGNNFKELLGLYAYILLFHSLIAGGQCFNVPVVCLLLKHLYTSS